jgi:hypothetical protein
MQEKLKNNLCQKAKVSVVKSQLWHLFGLAQLFGYKDYPEAALKAAPEAAPEAALEAAHWLHEGRSDIYFLF